MESPVGGLGSRISRGKHGTGSKTRASAAVAVPARVHQGGQRAELSNQRTENHGSVVYLKLQSPITSIEKSCKALSILAKGIFSNLA